jgi:hypothetical protein
MLESGERGGGNREVDASTIQTVRDLVTGAEHLFRKQMELAQAELKVDLRAQAKAFGSLGIGALAALVAVTMFLVTATLALAAVMPPWLAGLIVSGAVAAVAGTFAVIGWRRRVRQPLLLTREALKRDARWVKERLA